MQANLNAKLFSAVDATVRSIPRPLPAIADASKCDHLRPNATQEGEKCKTNPNEKRSLSPRQRSAAAMLVSGKSVISVARSLGVHKATLFRWKSAPEFIDEVNRRVNELAQPAKTQAARIAPRQSPTPPTTRGYSDLVRSLLSEMDGSRGR